MKKSTLVAMMLVMLLVLLSACSASNVEVSPFRERMHHYYVDRGCAVYVDSVTGVCYLWKKDGYGGGITVMVDANGKPLIYKGE